MGALSSAWRDEGVLMSSRMCRPPERLRPSKRRQLYALVAVGWMDLVVAGGLAGSGPGTRGAGVPGGGEVAAWDAICQAFPNEFVILGDVDVRDEVSLEVMGGVVLAHGTSRKEALERHHRCTTRRGQPVGAHLFTPAMERPCRFRCVEYLPPGGRATSKRRRLPGGGVPAVTRLCPRPACAPASAARHGCRARRGRAPLSVPGAWKWRLGTWQLPRRHGRRGGNVGVAHLVLRPAQRVEHRVHPGQRERAW